MNSITNLLDLEDPDIIISDIQIQEQVKTITLKSYPREKTSNQPLIPTPQQVGIQKGQSITTDPQKLWQTLKNFGYPFLFQQQYITISSS